MRNESQTIRNRQVCIDYIEVIALFFVIFYHSTIYNSDYREDSNIFVLGRYWIRTFLSTCVPLFFFSNGYLLLNKEFRMKKHLKKVFKTVCLTAFWGSFTLLLLMPVKEEYFNFAGFMNALCELKSGWIFHLWYLGSLAGIYLLFPIIKYIFDTEVRLFQYFLALCFILTFGRTLLVQCTDIIQSIAYHVWGISLQFWGRRFLDNFNIFNGIRGYVFVYFCVGGYSFKFKEYIMKYQKKLNVLAIASLLISGTCLMVLGMFYSVPRDSDLWDVVWNGYDTMPTLINVVCLFVLSLNFQIESNLIRKISENTLGVYFVHWVLIEIFAPIFTRYVLLQSLFGCVLLSIIVLVSSLLVVLFVKKLPYVQWFLSL